MQEALSTNLQELTGSWLVMNAHSQTAPAQLLGAAAYAHGSFEALRVPSGQDPRATNLVIFLDRLHPSSRVRVYDDSGLIDATLH